MTSFRWTDLRTKTVLKSTHKMGFHGTHFGSPVLLNHFASSFHILDLSDDGRAIDLCAEPHCNCVVYVDENNCLVNGVASPVGDVLRKRLMLRIEVTFDKPARTFDTTFFAYNNIDRTCDPVGVMAYAFEFRNKSWSPAVATNALVLRSQRRYAKRHVWYVAVSVCPTILGIHTDLAFSIDTHYNDADGGFGTANSKL